ncbi:hypothetical protein DFJ74DRAFT_652622 [Hyaloraphidium curvatum]|nr:hypothetical protein DFJ74DRAFT_652622 [Hyaloraphidium curvatum]
MAPSGSLPATYTRIEYPRFGPSTLLAPSAPLPLPSPGAGEVLVRVRAASVNPKDTFVRKGRYAFMSGRKFPMGTGTDFCGVVEAVGAGVEGVKEETRVWGGLNGFALGTLAEFIAIPAVQVSPAPPELSDEEASAFPVAALTALQALRDYGLQARTSAGGKPRVLVNGASGGVGHFAVQIARRAFGAHVTALCSEPNFEFVKGLGADVCLDYRADGMRGHEHEKSRDADPEATEDGRFDVWFDCFGNRSFSEIRNQLRPGGTYITTVPSVTEFANAYLLTGWFGSASSKVVVVNVSGPELEKLARIVSEHRIRPHIDAVYGYADAAQAHAHVEGKRTRGKVVVAVSGRAERPKM